MIFFANSKIESSIINIYITILSKGLKRSLIPLIILLQAFNINAQENLTFFIYGKITPDIGVLRNAKVFVYENSVLSDTIKVFSSGKFDYDCEYNNNYEFKFECEKYVTQLIRLNTNVSEEVMNRNNKFPPFEFQVTIFREFPEVDYYLFDNSVITILYNKKIDHFEYNYDYYDDLIDQYTKENKKAKSKNEKQLQEDEKSLANQKAYDKAISNADKYFEEQRYIKSKEGYEQALIFKPKESYPVEQISNIQKIFDVQKEKELAIQAIDEKYNSIIDEADLLFKNDNHIAAKGKYIAALEIKPDEAYPKYKLEDIKTIKVLKIKTEKYLEVLAKADNAFDNKNYTNAKSLYNEAITIKPKERYPKTRLIEIDKILSENALAEKDKLARDKAYNDLITAANNEFNSENWTQAKKYYNDALGIKSEEQYPKDQISKIDIILKEIADKADSDRELNESYSNAIIAADKLFKSKEYIESKDKYELALSFKPEEEYPKQKIAEIIGILENIEKAKADDLAKEQAYNNAIEAGDKNFDDKSYADAKGYYNEALSIKPSEKYPKTKIAEINKLLANLDKAEKEKLARDKAYNDLITAADNEFNSENWSPAKKYYNDALGIKSEEQYPKDQISKIDIRLKEIAEKADSNRELNESYSNAIIAADKLFKSKDYTESKDKYELALNFKPNEDYPKQKIAEIIGILEDIEKVKADDLAKEQAYNNAIEAGDKNFEDKSYIDSKGFYNEALSIKPTEKYPKTRIAEINKLLTNLDKAEKEKLARDKAYNDLIKAADNEFNSENWSQAKKYYNDALGIKSEEQYPKDQISKINIRLKEIADKADSDRELNESYSNAIIAADKLFKSKDYIESKDKYELALSFKPEEDYPKQKIAEIIGILEDIEKAKADDLAKEQAYNNAIEAGDKNFDDKSYIDSKEFYNEALSIKPSEKYPKTRIAEINKLLANLDKAEKEKLARDKAYNDLITAADNEFNNENWLPAKKYYNDALGIKSEEQYPKDQISKIDIRLKEIADKDDSNRELNESYSNAIIAADKLFKSKDYIESKDKYELALSFKPDEDYPKQKIAEIIGILENIEKAKADDLAKEQAYNNAIEAGDKNFDDKSYADAKGYYNEALSIKPSEKYPKTKIAEINKLLANLDKAEKEKLARDKAYNDLIEAADNAFTNENWSPAKKYYNDALGIKPEEQYPKDQISKIDIRLKEIADKTDSDRELNESYSNAIIAADKLFKSKDYIESKDKYELALSFKPEEDYPKQKIAEIIGILEDIEKAKADDLAKEQAYNNAIEAGDKNFDDKSYIDSKGFYNEALSIKPSEKYPKTRIAEINKLLANLDKAEKEKLARDKAYNDLITAADNEFNNENWLPAKKYYNDALGIKSEEQHPKDQISKIDIILKEIADKADSDRELNESYSNAIIAADKLFKSKDYTESKDKYELALSFKPEEAYPKNQISRIEKIIKSISDKNQLALNAKEYSRLIIEGDKYFISKEYILSRDSYELALDIKPGELYPVTRISEIDAILAMQKLDNDKQSAIDKEYNDAIQIADFQFTSQQYKVSKSNYSKALEIKPYEFYPKNQIAEINLILRRLKKQVEQKGVTKDEYLLAIENGDKSLFHNELTIARFYYKKALILREYEEYPKKKLKEIEDLRYQLKKQETQKNFNEAIDYGDGHLKEEEFTVAKFYYNKASGIKPQDPLPQQKLLLVDLAMKLKKDKENLAKLSELYKLAEEYINNKDYTLAEYYFVIARKEGLNIEFIDNKLDEISNLKKQLIASEKLAEYNNNIETADSYFNNEDYSAARFFYRKAVELNREAKYPDIQLEKIKELFSPGYRAKMEAYRNAIYKAERSYDHGDLKMARMFYKNALELKPKDKVAEAKLKLIKETLDKQKEK